MTNYLTYSLKNGYVHNWLVAGPHATPVEGLEQFQGDDYKLQIARHYHRRLSEIHEPPIEKGTFQVGEEEHAWRYYRCLDDHYVDLSTFYHTTHHLRSWAYCQVEASSPQQVSLTLTTNGPADVWINGQHVHRQEHFHHQDPKRVSFDASLQEGWNELLVRFEEVAARECPYVVALHVAGLNDDAPVRLPTYIEHIEARQFLEEVFEQAHTELDVVYKGNDVSFHWSDDLERRAHYTYQVQDGRNRIYLEGQQIAEAGATVNAGHPARLWQGDYYVVLRPLPEQYYMHNIRYERRIPVAVLDYEFSTEPYSTLAERRHEALEHAIAREQGLYSEIAKLEIGRWANVDDDVVLEAVGRINDREDCSDFYLVGILGMLYRYADRSTFPSALRAPLESCVLNFKYWHDEPGADAMCYTTENHSILFHACEVLAGQRYPDRTFSNAGQTGEWHREKGERLALEWLRQRGTTGFTEWDSNCYFEEDLLALSHLHDLAENDELRELAAVVMDKMLFTMAANSYKGVFGSTHGRTYAPFIKGGQLEATSGISRLLWGMGVWNDHIRGMVALACSEYELPPMIAGIAAYPEEVWEKEQHPGVNKVTYRTADYMLASAQDHHAGEKGYQQHIWQATLGPNAVVFVTHPPCMSEEGAHRPNFWHGNYVLPRVAQWKDVLLAIHELPEDDWMGFTHAYFPAYAFDEYRLRDGWAFARKGPGYLALRAARGLELVKEGPSAYRELRSHGPQNVWLCHMGRAAEDGAFEEFQKKVLALDVQLEGLSATCETLRGDHLSFGWEGPFTVNEEEQALAGFMHYDGPFSITELPAQHMDIVYGEVAVRLHFEPQGEVEMVDEATSDEEPST
jgi:hypothetical protein